MEQKLIPLNDNICLLQTVLCGYYKQPFSKKNHDHHHIPYPISEKKTGLKTCQGFSDFIKDIY